MGIHLLPERADRRDRAAAGPRLVPESRLATERRRCDVTGAIAITGGLVLLVDAISQAPQYGGGDTRTLALLAASVAFLAAFLVIEGERPGVGRALPDGSPSAKRGRSGRPAT